MLNPDKDCRLVAGGLRVAIISPFPLGRLETGGESRVNFIADSLSRNGVEVHVFSRKLVDDVTFCREVRFHSSPWLTELIPQRMTPNSIARASAAQIGSLRHLVGVGSFDIVQSAGMTVALYGLMMSRLQGAACVLDEPDAEFEKAREMRNAGDWRTTLLVEKSFARLASMVLVSSSREKRLMTSFFRLKDRKVAVIPNGVDTSRFAPSSETSDLWSRLDIAGRKTVLFMGNFDYFPNKDSLRITISELIPRVARSVPEVTFVVVGKGLVSSTVPKADNLMPIGFVDDPRPYVEAADVCIAPIRFGGGTRIKILEYMSMAKAVVSTSKGCEGLQVADGTDILIRDDWSAFSQAVVNLLIEREYALKIGAEARQTVKKLYDWNEIAKQLVRTYKGIIDL
jgi:glycosyltransferase involved in cell wall biosynthesis